MNTKKSSALDFYMAQLATLIGSQITGLATDPDGEFFGLQLTFRDGTKKVIFLLSDDEGNGHGSFEIQDI